MPRIWAAVAIALGLAGPAAAANLVPNPGFDDQDLSAWVPTNLAYAEWSLIDELGIPPSGSMRFHNSGLSQNQVRLCIPVTGGISYAFGASARIPASGALSQSAHTAVQWWSSADCGGGELQPGTGGGSVAAQLRGSWGTVEGWATAPSGALSANLVLISIAATRTGFEVLFDNAFFIEDATCAATPTALCLNDERFLVTSEWGSRHGVGGYGWAAPLTDDSGYVWFFVDQNVELMVKLLDACSTTFHRFWFFAAGLTDVAVTLRVYDTRGGGVRTYFSPLEQPFIPVQDTDAFATCP